MVDILLPRTIARFLNSDIYIIIIPFRYSMIDALIGGVVTPIMIFSHIYHGETKIDAESKGLNSVE